MWLKLGEYEFALDKLSKCPTQTWYSIHQKLYPLEPWGVIKESKKHTTKSIKEERYDVELSDYSGSIVDEETFDKKSDAIQWAKDNGRNCYARNSPNFNRISTVTPKTKFFYSNVIIGCFLD